MVSYSATLNANSKFPLRFFGFNRLKSNVSGTKWWIKAQKAIPSAQLEEKFVILTFFKLINN